MTKKHPAGLCAILVTTLLLLMGCDRDPKPTVTHEDLVELSGYRALVLQVPRATQGKWLYYKKERSNGHVDYWSAFEVPDGATEIRLLVNPFERTLHYAQGVGYPDSRIVLGGYTPPGQESPFAYPEYTEFACPGGTMKLSDFYFVYSDEWAGRDLALGQAIFPEDDERSKARWMLITLIPESELPKGWLGHNQD